jgi:hypothetical protein
MQNIEAKPLVSQQNDTALVSFSTTRAGCMKAPGEMTRKMALALRDS